jgi:hypothetical protein
MTYRKSKPSDYRKEVLPYTMKQVQSTLVTYFWKFMHGNFNDNNTLETFMHCLCLIGSRKQYKYGPFLIGGKKYRKINHDKND